MSDFHQSNENKQEVSGLFEQNRNVRSTAKSLFYLIPRSFTLRSFNVSKVSDNDTTVKWLQKHRR